MADRRGLLEIQTIADDDCGMYRIGEIDTVPDEAVRQYIAQHGEFGYSELLDFGASLMAAARESIKYYRHAQHAATASTSSVCAERGKPGA